LNKKTVEIWYVILLPVLYRKYSRMTNNNAEYKTEQYLKEFYDLSNTTNIKGFYYETRLHSVIVLEISLASLNKNHPVSFEYLCETIPKKLGKRTTIQTILNEGLRKGYFLKTLNEKDKRVKFYTLEKDSLSIIEKWWTDRKEFSNTQF
jgi:hypothetical protein